MSFERENAGNAAHARIRPLEGFKHAHAGLAYAFAQFETVIAMIPTTRYTD